MRKGITVEVSAADRVRLEAVVADRNSPQKHVWQAKIILATADGLGTTGIMRRGGKLKPSVWRWQERFMTDGVDGLLRDKTRPSRIPPLEQTIIDRVIALTATEPPHDALRRARRALVIGRCMQHHRHQEFIRFLNTIAAAVRRSARSCTSSTTTPRTNTRRSRRVWSANCASSSTSRRPPAPGSMFIKNA